jgi:hypothetical protein
MVVVVLMLAGCGATELTRTAVDGAFGTTTTATTVTLAIPATPKAPGSVGLWSCQDWTKSVPDSLRRAGAEAMARTIERWPPASPGGQVRTAQPGRQGLQVWVHAIDANSYGQGGGPDLSDVIATGLIPPVAALPMAASPPTSPPPAGGGSPGVLSPDEIVRWAQAWSREQRRWRAAVGAARARAAALARAVRTYNRPLADSSDVDGCLSAVAEVSSRAHLDRKILLVVSDLERSGAQNVTGRLDGFDVLVVLWCGTAAECDQKKRDWTARFVSLGAAKPVYLRPDQADDIPALVTRQ